jgi:hypothetical protein
MHLDLLPNSEIIHETDEGVDGWGRWLIRLFLWLLLVECLDL